LISRKAATASQRLDAASLSQTGILMSHVANDLHKEFPADSALLHDLKVSDRHFRGFAERYDDLNKAIYRMEAGIDPASAEAQEVAKKQRLALLDEIATLISKAKASAAAK